jgi:hypothetical protein
MADFSIFVSYSWDSEAHKIRVRELVERLRNDRFTVVYDQDGLRLGRSTTKFMESAVRDNPCVLVVLTPNYKAKADSREGGAGYETEIMTEEAYKKENEDKFIPVLFEGTFATAKPTWIGSRYGADFTSPSRSDSMYALLADELRERVRESAAAPAAPPAEPQDLSDFEISGGVLVKYHGFDPEVTITSSVTSIGDGAFSGCHSLTSITIPNSVTSIGFGAFRGCRNLTCITIPSGVTSISYDAFCYCTALTSISIPSSVASIGGNAFYECGALTSITIPSSVTSIGGYAFAYCGALTNITIPDSVTSIGDHAFRHIPKVTIRGKRDSYAITYAHKNKIPFTPA